MVDRSAIGARGLVNLPFLTIPADHTASSAAPFIPDLTKRLRFSKQRHSGRDK